MVYKLNLKKKKYFASQKTKFLPFPLTEEDQKVECIFNGFSVEIIDSSYFNLIYDNGCYGKGSVSRSAPDILKNKSKENNLSKTFKETLVLDLEEAFLLNHFVKTLEIKNIKSDPIDNYELFDKFCKIKPNFIESMVAYLYLKSNEWIIKSGIKFGANFLIYKESVRLYHASFAVIIENNFPSSSRNIQTIQRVAESADKDVMIVHVYKPDNLNIDNLKEVFSRLTEFKVQEVIVKRFDLTKNNK